MMIAVYGYSQSIHPIHYKKHDAARVIIAAAIIFTKFVRQWYSVCTQLYIIMLLFKAMRYKVVPPLYQHHHKQVILYVYHTPLSKNRAR